MTARLSVSQGAALSIGAVLGTGLISLPALAAAAAGPAALVAWLALIVLSAPLAWTFAALGARYPDGGGVATYAGMAFGRRASAAVGWCFYFAVPLGAPVAAAFTGGYVAGAVGGGRTTEFVTFLGVVTAGYAMNWFGLRVSGRVQLVLTGTLATLLVVTVLAALPHLDLGNLHPFAPHGLAGIGSATALLVWGFAGWEALSSLSAEYRNPRRDVPRATMLAVAVVGVLYLAVAAVSVLALGPALAGSRAPLADLLAIGLGGPVRAITAVVSVVLTLGAVNAYYAGSSRLGVALAADGALPARVFGGRRRSLTFIYVASILCALLPLGLRTSALLVTGCFTLVYVFGTAAAVRLLPRGWSRAVAGVAFVAVCGLFWLNGWPALLSLVFAAGALIYRFAVDRAAGRAGTVRSGAGAAASRTDAGAGSAIGAAPDTHPASGARAGSEQFGQKCQALVDERGVDGAEAEDEARPVAAVPAQVVDR
ncbi:amino acid permease [Actinoplanes sp. SE50]|uniref:APC family permease n=1 Tax=unclassified Actinoplanes TaxID=2626549 RepID=UPI00023ECE1F|nr:MULTISPECIES: amino acid permease [unclassified Actinoplanes]AEV82692.1 putative amino-acid permease [Actinoplanes sp. SE50/110]ATO81088.1 amino acid permease [Actinoplanes sp. SE50]SLL98495.1 Inner membrane protein YjeH [Actinoplanes sp. SE50/110]